MKLHIEPETFGTKYRLYMNDLYIYSFDDKFAAESCMRNIRVAHDKEILVSEDPVVVTRIDPATKERVGRLEGRVKAVEEAIEIIHPSWLKDK